MYNIKAAGLKTWRDRRGWMGFLVRSFDGVFVRDTDPLRPKRHVRCIHQATEAAVLDRFLRAVCRHDLPAGDTQASSPPPGNGLSRQRTGLLPVWRPDGALSRHVGIGYVRKRGREGCLANRAYVRWEGSAEIAVRVRPGETQVVFRPACSVRFSGGPFRDEAAREARRTIVPPRGDFAEDMFLARRDCSLWNRS